MNSNQILPFCKYKILIFCFYLILPLITGDIKECYGVEYQQVAGLIDLRTTYSDGDLDPESLVQIAKKRGFEAVFINDHDRLVMEYGLFPFPHVIKKKKELNSINNGGAEEFLQGIKKTKQKFPDMIVIPGSQTVSYYYWTGSYFKKNLTANDHEKRILTIGMNEPDDYENLPILHNGFSTRHIKHFIFPLALFLISFIFGVFLFRERGFLKTAGGVIAFFSFLFIINTNPFRSSPFDQYKGNIGIKPYQLLIDYVSSREGMTIWNYPETKSGKRKLGPIYVDTPPYPEALLQSVNYTGFAALYGDTTTIIEPGDIWDRVLLEYCQGQRTRPVWGVSTADFHKDGGAGEMLGNFPTVFFVKKKTKSDVLSALKEGRMYACRGKYPQRIILDKFSVGSDIRNMAVSGEGIKMKSNPWIHIYLSSKVASKAITQVKIIRSGIVIKTFDSTMPMEIEYEDKYYNPGEKTFYRIDVKNPGQLISNPIFVTFE
jgi:hypothetical protein